MQLARDPVAQRIRDLRFKQALTQVELAALAGLNRNTIVEAEQGHPLRPSTVRKIALALGVPPTRLTLGHDS